MGIDMADKMAGSRSMRRCGTSIRVCHAAFEYVGASVIAQPGLVDGSGKRIPYLEPSHGVLRRCDVNSQSRRIALTPDQTARLLERAGQGTAAEANADIDPSGYVPQVSCCRRFVRLMRSAERTFWNWAASPWTWYLIAESRRKIATPVSGAERCESEGPALRSHHHKGNQ